MAATRVALLFSAFLIFRFIRPDLVLAAEPHAGDDVVRQVQELVHTKFYDADRAKNFDLGLDAYEKSAGDRYNYQDAIRSGLAALKASHTDFYTSKQLDYYELLDIFYPALSRSENARLTDIFPPDGLPKYEGIGIVTSRADNGWYVSDIYDASPAARTQLAVGDLILEADGHPFDPLLSFRGKVGKTVTLTVSKSKHGVSTPIPIQAIKIRPNEMTDASIGASVKTFSLRSGRVGYLHLWTYSTPDVQDVVEKLLSGKVLQDVDGLILDMRCRHGGAPPAAAETFVGITPELDMVSRSGKATVNFRYRKPLVGLIDGGTRSGLEVLAYSLKKAGVVLVGDKTAGAMLGGSPFILKDGSLLYLAVMNAMVDGHPLEGVGVTPTLGVAYDKLFSHGHDPQLQAALLQMEKALQRNRRPS